MDGSRLVRRIQLIVLDSTVMAIFAAAYFGVRALTQPDPHAAVHNARKVDHLERVLHVPSEQSLQRLILDHHLVVVVSNWVYVWGHWPAIVAVLVWLVVVHRPEFARTRDALLVSGLIGLVAFATFPVAPPRFVEPGLVDTVSEYSRSYRVLQPPSLANLYAAMPSLHVGWNLLVGIALWRCARHWTLRVVAVALPVLMGISVILTGNHYVLDGVAGSGAALVGLWLASQRERYRARRRIAREAAGVRSPGPRHPT